MTTASDIRAKSPDELKALLVDLRKEQFNLRFQRATGQRKTPAACAPCAATSRALRRFSRNAPAPPRRVKRVPCRNVF